MSTYPPGVLPDRPRGWRPTSGRIVSGVDDADAILRHYEAIREEERITAGLGQLELVRTQEILRRHLPSPPARLLDVGGGTGVHAAWLAEDSML